MRFEPKLSYFHTPQPPKLLYYLPVSNHNNVGVHMRSKGGADSQALLEPVVCHNSLSVAPQNTMIQSWVLGALQGPKHLQEEHCTFGAKIVPIFTPHPPQHSWTIRPFQNTTMWGPHEKKRGRIVKHFWGLWYAEIAHGLAPKPLCSILRCTGHCIAPGTNEWITVLLEPNGSYFHTSYPPNSLDYTPLS